MIAFMPLILVLIGQFCRDVIGRQNVKDSCNVKHSKGRLTDNS